MSSNFDFYSSPDFAAENGLTGGRNVPTGKEKAAIDQSTCTLFLFSRKAKGEEQVSQPLETQALNN